MKEALGVVVKRQEELIEAQSQEIKSLTKTLNERDQLLEDQRELLETLGRVDKALKEVVTVEKNRADGQLREAVKLAEAQGNTIQSLNETIEDLRGRVKMLVGG